MKKYWKLLLCAALTVGAFTACEDVPEPYNIPTEQGGTTPIPAGIEVTCAEAVELTSQLADGATSSETYTITGYITEIVGEVSKNQQTFWMADTPDGGRIFEAYWANLPSGVTEFKAGSKVKITGKLTKYVNNNTGKMTAEIKNAAVEILEEGGGVTPAEGIEVTCAEAVELTSKLADGGTSAETYTVTGYITEVVGNVSKNQQTFWMADAKGGGRIFEAYWANLPEGVTEFKVGSKVKITGKLMKYVKDGQVTPEIKNANVVILEEGGDTPPPAGKEVTCAQAVELTNALADDATSSETYSVTGYITEVVGNVSKDQQTFWMADTPDGGKVFEAYWANLPSGVSAFKKGMKVKITGQLMKYVKDGQVTPEIKNANVVILEEGGGDTPTPAGKEVTCAEAVKLTNALSDGGTSTETYTVTGYITEVVGNVSRNQQTFWMADTKEGGKVFEAYWANLPEGVSAFKVGMKVKITGQLMKYVKDGNVTPEIKNADVQILSDGGGDNPDPSTGGTTLADFTNGDFETWAGGKPTNWESSSSKATLSQSTIAHGGQYSCKVEYGSQNQRLAYKDLTLEPGTYTITAYVRAFEKTAIARIGYHANAYTYGPNTTVTTEWQQLTHTFELSASASVSLLMMNSASGEDKDAILVDDFTIVKK